MTTAQIIAIIIGILWLIWFIWGLCTLGDDI